jgi:hypothetical protein
MFLVPSRTHLTLLYVQACFDHDVCLQKYSDESAAELQCGLYPLQGMVCWCEQQLINAAKAVPKKDCSWWNVSEECNTVDKGSSPVSCCQHARVTTVCRVSRGHGHMH